MGEGKFGPATVLEFDSVQKSGKYDLDCKENQLQQDGQEISQKEGNTEKAVDRHHPVENMAKTTLRSFIQAFDDENLIQSPIIKSLSSPDIKPALSILGTKYNTLMEKLQIASKKCKEECEPRYNTLKKKYTEECSERKRLYNELIEMRGNIRVFCRCRPLNSDEISKGHSNIAEFDSSHESDLQLLCNDSSKKQFKFDHVFPPCDNQEVVFGETLPVVMSALDGYNVCIFAYGQTGTGKTFTMEGNQDNRGVNYRALEVLFNTSKERESDVAYGFSVSMLEVYNEKIRDLLADSTNPKKLEIKQSIDGTQEVPGLVESEVKTINQVWEILKTGAKNRSVGSTSANELSSRSHCLVRVTIKSENLVSGQRNKSQMWLVDLAGSERVSKIDVEGERLKESQFINRSLSALGDVISSLASKNNHIPYRNSKLTHLLQSSLGGDCKTLMFVQISPSSSDLGETICSLNFATRVRGIEQGPARKQSDPAETFRLKQITDKLRHEERENVRLNENLQLVNLKYASRENVIKSLQDKIKDGEQAIRNCQQKVRDLENQLAEVKRHSKETTTTNNNNDYKDPISKFAKPPLARTFKRAPLSRINNNQLPPLSRSKLTTNSTALPTLKENKASSGYEITNKVVGKARRVSVVPTQPKRRSSLYPSFPNPQALNAERKMAELEHQLSQLRPTRRKSVAAFNSFNIPGTPRAALGGCGYSRITPDSVSRFRSFFGSSSKYAMSPNNNNNNNHGGRNKIPSVRLVPGRLNEVGGPHGTASKLCFSVQKRVMIGSPPKMLRGFGVGVNNGGGAAGSGLHELAVALRSKEGGGNGAIGGGGAGGGGHARRVLCNPKRRMSVM